MEKSLEEYKKHAVPYNPPPAETDRPLLDQFGEKISNLKEVIQRLFR